MGDEMTTKLLELARAVVAVIPREREDGYCLYCDEYILPPEVDNEEAIEDWGGSLDSRHGDCSWLLLKKEVERLEMESENSE